MPADPARAANARAAARLEEFAALLELADAGYYTARAYRRAADLVRALDVPVESLVRSGRVRDLRGIGPSIEHALRELIESGDIADLAERRADTPLALAAYGRLIGLGAKRAVAIGAALEIASVEQFRGAVRSGRLRDVRGIGAKTEARIRAMVEEEPAAQPAGPLPPRARTLPGSTADGVGGFVAGDARRWTDVVRRLGVVVASSD